MMKIPQESCCRCHFLSPSKERIIHSYPDKVHNYGYGSVQFRIQTVTDKTGSCRSVLVPTLCIIHFLLTGAASSSLPLHLTSTTANTTKCGEEHPSRCF